MKRSAFVSSSKAQESEDSNYNAMLSWGAEDPKTGQKHYPVHEHQARVLYHEKARKARFIAAIAGTGGGKTVTGPLWVAMQVQKAIEKYGKCLGMIIAPTYKVLSRATMPTLVETFKGTNFEGVYKESKSQYVLPNDLGVIWCQGADNPGGLEGGQFDFVWGDEGGQFKVKTFHAIEGRTGAKQAPILITTTPYGLGYLHDVWFNRWKQNDPNYFIEQWASNTNPAYPKEEVERARQSLPKHKFEERYLGIFAGAEGRVYETIHRSYVTLTPKDVNGILRAPGAFHGGLDYGWNDPFCGLNAKLDKEDVLWVWFERYKSECPLEEHADYLPKTEHDYGRSTKYHSEHNPEAIKKLKRAGFVVVRAKKDIITGIMAVNRRINTGKLKIIENRCPAIVGEAEKYRYPDKDESIVGDKPIDEDNHAMDALRYLVMGVDHRNAA